MSVGWLELEPEGEEFPNEEEYAEQDYDAFTVYVVNVGTEHLRDEALDDVPEVSYEGDIPGMIESFTGDASFAYQFLNEDLLHRRYQETVEGESGSLDEEPPTVRTEVVGGQINMPKEVEEELLTIHEILSDRALDPKVRAQIQGDNDAGFLDIEDAEFQISNRQPYIEFDAEGVRGMEYDSPVKIEEYNPELLRLDESVVPEIFQGNPAYEQQLRGKVLEKLDELSDTGSRFQVDTGTHGGSAEIEPDDWEMVDNQVERDLVDDIAEELGERGIPAEKIVYGGEVLPWDVPVFSIPDTKVRE